MFEVRSSLVQIFALFVNFAKLDSVGYTYASFLFVCVCAKKTVWTFVLSCFRCSDEVDYCLYARNMIFPSIFCHGVP